MVGCLVIVAVLGLAGTVEAAVTPTERVRDAISAILVILKDGKLDRDDRWVKIGTIIDARFDFRSMSQSVLATNWRKATPEEKQRFVEFFSQYLEDTHRTKIEAYTDQHVEYLSESVAGDRAVVDTVIVTAATKIPVNYKLKSDAGDWFVYDVIIEGVSLVNNYRSTFSAIIKTEGMDGLLLDLQGRIQTYKDTHGGLPAP